MDTMTWLEQKQRLILHMRNACNLKDQLMNQLITSSRTWKLRTIRMNHAISSMNHLILFNT